MSVSRMFMAAWLVVCFSAQCGAQQRERQVSIEFGGARIALGMTVEEVQASLAKNGRQPNFLSDGQTATVALIGSAEPYGGEGQITFHNRRAVYAAYQFPETSDAVVLAQELEGAIESVEGSNCLLRNFTSHGTGGGHSDSIAYCGSRTIVVMTVEPLGSGNRSTHVEIEIGSLQ